MVLKHVLDQFKSIPIKKHSKIFRFFGHFRAQNLIFWLGGGGGFWNFFHFYQKNCIAVILRSTNFSQNFPKMVELLSLPWKMVGHHLPLLAITTPIWALCLQYLLNYSPGIYLRWNIASMHSCRGTQVRGFLELKKLCFTFAEEQEPRWALQSGPRLYFLRKFEAI